MRNFDFEEERMKQEILKLGAKRVLLQLPEGLKPDALRLAKIVEKTGALAIISADPCYGACDLATAEAESLGVDLIVHFGHARLVRYERVPTIYIEARATVKVEKAVEKALPLLEKCRRIGLTTTVQHVQVLDTVRELLVKNEKTVAIGDAGRLSYAGQVIGCDYSNAKSVAKNVDAFLFVGGGKFHALGVALSTMKPTVVADPYEVRGFSVDDEAQKIIRQRWASIEQARKAKNFAVLIGLKPGQKRLEQALQIKQKLEKKEKVANLFAVNEIVPEVLNEFPSVEAYVNTACPRVSLDDASRFRKPVLTVDEALVVVGELSWEELCRRGLLEG
ncbi:MAG TPA: diphthamide biosynthesis enzyme Dph2 [Candidatus Acidoferrum sp.]|jgi:2-(3-amino-3-carboxypropyl)histidine synthase|nr:diphthamide biosynthesis enzyme Dph2 [Candidatus Acidoferrum sp.]